jgi:hemoglobin
MDSKQNLYQVIGGEPVIAAAVEEFYQRVLADPGLRPFFQQTSMARLMGHQVAFLTRVLQEKPLNTARLEASHASRGIADAHFDRVAQHLVETLRSLGVAEHIVGQIVARVVPLRPHIVSPAAAVAAV